MPALSHSGQCPSFDPQLLGTSARTQRMCQQCLPLCCQALRCLGGYSGTVPCLPWVWKDGERPREQAKGAGLCVSRCLQQLQAEAEEEAITLKLMRRLEQLKREKAQLAREVRLSFATP